MWEYFKVKRLCVLVCPSVAVRRLHFEMVFSGAQISVGCATSRCHFNPIAIYSLKPVEYLHSLRGNEAGRLEVDLHVAASGSQSHSIFGRLLILAVESDVPDLHNGTYLVGEDVPRVDDCQPGSSRKPKLPILSLPDSRLRLGVALKRAQAVSVTVRLTAHHLDSTIGVVVEILQTHA